MKTGGSMNGFRVVYLLIIICSCGVFSRGEAPARSFRRNGLDPRVSTVVNDFRESVVELMKQHRVAGTAVALFDDQGVLWTEGFGFTAARGKIPVTPDTPFYLGSMSKLITATAVMVAVQDGLVELDKPITHYLPGFKVNSRYQNHSEQKITLRHLLNHTAGLPVEAPLGNHFEPSPELSFEAHVKSLYGCWLVFTPGQGFQCSHASLDLAAYVIQVTSGQPFEAYLREKIFIPLGMSCSLVERTAVLNAKDRAMGRMMGVAKMPAVFPVLGGACIYSSARDMARFMQMHINLGVVEGRHFLEPALVKILHKPVGIVKSPDVYYGSGMFIDKRHPERVHTILWQDGWGFGFSGLLHWYPEFGVGAIALSNRLPNPGMSNLGLSLTDQLIQQKLVGRRFPPLNPGTNQLVGAWWGWPDHQPTPYRAEWRKYCGQYRLKFTAYELEWWAKLAVLIKGRDELTPRITLQAKDGFLCLTESAFFDLIDLGRHKEQRLQEIKPGLFSTASGIVLNLAPEEPTWRNYRMEKH